MIFGSAQPINRTTLVYLLFKSIPAKLRGRFTTSLGFHPLPSVFSHFIELEEVWTFISVLHSLTYVGVIPTLGWFLGSLHACIFWV